jgi:hypothetical protein
MKVFGITMALSLAVAGSACLDDAGSGPTPLVNSQLAQYETQVAELRHQLAACYAGHEIEVGEEDEYLPSP